MIDSYSDSLMDDLFGDVDRLLNGDLSDYEPLVRPHSQLAPAPTSPIVQPASHFPARSAADVYETAIAACPSSSSSFSSSILSSLSPVPCVSSSYRTGYQVGEQPATRFEQSFVSILQSSMQTSGYPLADGASSADSVSSQGIPSANTNSFKLDPAVQPVLVSLYPPSPNSNSTTKTLSRPFQTLSSFKHWRASLLYLTMGAVGVIIAGVLGLWTASAALDTKLPLDSDPVVEPAAVSDADFLTYLEKALATVSASQRIAAQAVAITPVPALDLPKTLPTISAAASSAAGADGLPQLPSVVTDPPVVIDPPNVEHVSVPTYQNGRLQDNVAANSPSARATAALPPIALSAATGLPQRPTIPVLESSTAMALPPDPPTTGISSIPLVPASSESLPPPSVDLAVGSAVAPTAALNDVTPRSELALVGVLNLGDRSAALFEVDGSSQRAYVGDRIGLSNWTLVGVNGKDVMIRRNDEVRSVYIGQRF